jgi:hypothetical protein
MNIRRIKGPLVAILSAIGLPACGGAAACAAEIPSKTDIETALNAAYQNYRTV